MSIKYTIKSILAKSFKSLPISERMLLTNAYVKIQSELQSEDFNNAISTLIDLKALPSHVYLEVYNLLESIISTSEDCLNENSVVIISDKSPYKQSLLSLSKRINFSVVSHQLEQGRWTRDFLFSSGNAVHFPASPKGKKGYLNNIAIDRASSSNLYYGSLQMTQHHQVKTSISTSDFSLWNSQTKTIFKSTCGVKRAKIEGGNCFCAVNQYGVRYFLIGENVVSETMADCDISREHAIKLIAEDLYINEERLLILPQWTYHLDLQMAYLGSSQFIIHSFEQDEFEFEIDFEEKAHCRSTFAFLREKFEESIINTICTLLREHHFKVDKVFGMLFYLTDITDTEQLKYVPYCKNDDNFSGSVAFMMNGFSLSINDKKYFVTLKCDDTEFHEQFTSSLKKFDVDLEYVEVPEFIDPADNTFNGVLAYCLGAYNLTHFMAAENGGLRCQTTIIGRHLLHEKKAIASIIEQSTRNTRLVF